MEKIYALFYTCMFNNYLRLFRRLYTHPTIKIFNRFIYYVFVPTYRHTIIFKTNHKIIDKMLFIMYNQ